MNSVYTVDVLANRYADKKMAEPANRGADRDRFIYDFKVTGFNLTTAVAITTVALAILTTSPLFLILALLSWNARGSFMGNIDQNRAVVQALNIQDPNWQPVQLQLLDLRLWMNWVPNHQPAPVVEAAPVVAAAPIPVLPVEPIVVEQEDLNGFENIPPIPAR